MQSTFDDSIIRWKSVPDGNRYRDCDIAILEMKKGDGRVAVAFLVDKGKRCSRHRFPQGESRAVRLRTRETQSKVGGSGRYPDRGAGNLWPDATLARRASISSLAVLGRRRCPVGYIKTNLFHKKPINTG
jgi:hypothetical protein